jgi:hypothetical protein
MRPVGGGASFLEVTSWTVFLEGTFLAESIDKPAPAADASDEDINRWWQDMRHRGQTDKEIQRGLINIMVQSYKEILLELDAAQLAGFEAESFPHWFGAYRPMFPETGHGSDGSGAMRMDSLRSELEFAARKDVTNPSERMRALHGIYVRHATGVAERTEMLAMAVMAEWLPAAGLRGPRTGPGTGQGRTPGATGTADTKPIIRVNLLKQKPSQQKAPAKPATQKLADINESFDVGKYDGDTPNFHALVYSQQGKVTYEVKWQVTRIAGKSDAAATAKRTEALRFAARAANESGEPTFKMKVNQANKPSGDNIGSLESSRKLVQEVGLIETQKETPVAGTNTVNYEAMLDTAKVLKKYGP